LEEKENFDRKMTFLTILIQLKRPCQAMKFGPLKDFNKPTTKTKKREASEEKK